MLSAENFMEQDEWMKKSLNHTNDEWESDSETYDSVSGEIVFDSGMCDALVNQM